MLCWLFPNLGTMSSSKPTLVFLASALGDAFYITAKHDFFKARSLCRSLLLPLTCIELTEAHEICRLSIHIKILSYSFGAHIRQAGVDLRHIPCTRDEVFMDKLHSLAQSHHSAIRFMSLRSYFRGCLRPPRKGSFPDSNLYMEAQHCCSVMVWDFHILNGFAP